MDESTTFEEIFRNWPENQKGLYKAFARLTDQAQNQPECTWKLLARPGISYSFRAAPADGPPSRKRPVYFLVDIVISQADPWFLSVCFYEDEISDPEDLGNPIPQGLFQETGYCFDVDDFDPRQLEYLEERMIEARQSALESHGGK